MSSIMRFRAGAVVAFASVLCVSAAARSGVPTACSSDTFSIDGSVVTLRVCDLPQPVAGRPRAKSAAPPGGYLSETVAVKDRMPIVRSVRYERLANEDTAHTLDDVPLQQLGIERTLHLALAVRNGSARLEHALLVPGAVSLK